MTNNASDVRQWRRARLRHNRHSLLVVIVMLMATADMHLAVDIRVRQRAQSRSRQASVVGGGDAFSCINQKHHPQYSRDINYTMINRHLSLRYRLKFTLVSSSLAGECRHNSMHNFANLDAIEKRSEGEDALLVPSNAAQVSLARHNCVYSAHLKLSCSPHTRRTRSIDYNHLACASRRVSVSPLAFAVDFFSVRRD